MTHEISTVPALDAETWFRVSDFGFRVSGFGFRVSGFGFRASDFGFGDLSDELRVQENLGSVRAKVGFRETHVRASPSMVNDSASRYMAGGAV